MSPSEIAAAVRSPVAQLPLIDGKFLKRFVILSAVVPGEAMSKQIKQGRYLYCPNGRRT